jgi:DnaJ-class molecular chaperone
MTTPMHDVSSAEDTPDAVREIQCKRCRGTGEDREGADCAHCDGYGTLLL